MRLMKTAQLTTLVAFGLAGCANFERPAADMDALHKVQMDRITKMRQGQEQAIAEPSPTRQQVGASWVTNATSPLAVVKRPVQMDHKIELSGNRPLTISEVASRITLLTGMPVTLAPDVFRGPQLPAPVSFQGTVEELLNRVAGANRLTQRIENGGVTLFRYETAVLRIKRKPGRLQTSTQIGVTGSSTGSSSGTTSGSEMAASITGQAIYDPWTELAGKIRAVLTPEGKVQEAAASSSLIVTDVPEAVALAKKIVDDDNKLATTPITVKVEVINITTNDDQNLGVNWNMVFASLSAGNPYANLVFSAPGSLATGNVGKFKIEVPTGSSSRFANSDFLVEALNKVGKAQTLLRRDFTSLHNVPSGFARTNSRSYRARTTAAPASSVSLGGGGQVGVEPGQVTTGVRFIVTPTYLGDGEFAVELNYNDSFLRELVPLGTGQQTIDAPDVDGSQFFNVTTAKIGETAIINAFESETMDAGNQGLVSSLKTSMRNQASKVRIYILLTVTGGPQ